MLKSGLVEMVMKLLSCGLANKDEGRDHSTRLGWRVIIMEWLLVEARVFATHDLKSVTAHFACFFINRMMKDHG